LPNIQYVRFLGFFILGLETVSQLPFRIPKQSHNNNQIHYSANVRPFHSISTTLRLNQANRD
jgi:hypothetical protein